MLYPSVYRYAEGRRLPAVDEVDNLECKSVMRDNGQVTVRFKRKKVTGDNRDEPLDECRYFLYAWGGAVGDDPPRTLERHTRQFVSGSRVCPPSPDACPAPRE